MSGRKASGPVSATAPGIGHDLPLDLHLRVPNRAYQVAASVELNLASWNASSRVIECRVSHRIAYHRPMLVTPLDDRTAQPVGEPMMVAARDISLAGVSFVHRDPLSCRAVVCTFEPHEEDSSESVIVRLTWCRFTRHGYYQSGGNFVRIVELALDVPIDWSRPPS